MGRGPYRTSRLRMYLRVYPQVFWDEERGPEENRLKVSGIGTIARPIHTVEGVIRAGHLVVSCISLPVRVIIKAPSHEAGKPNS